MTRAEQLAEMTARHRDLIYETADAIWKHPETGYREWKTTAYLEAQFEKLGYRLVKAGNIPGFYTDLDTGKPGPKIAILGELEKPPGRGPGDGGSARLRAQCPVRHPDRRGGGAEGAGGIGRHVRFHPPDRGAGGRTD